MANPLGPSVPLCLDWNQYLNKGGTLKSLCELEIELLLFYSIDNTSVVSNLQSLKIILMLSLFNDSKKGGKVRRRKS